MYFYKFNFMNTINWLVVVWMLFIHQADARTFTLMDGSTLEGEIQDYDLRQDRLTIRSSSGRKVIKADKLDNESYRYVMNWGAAKQFSNPDKFRLTMYGPEELNSWIKDIWLRLPGKLQPWNTHNLSFSRIGYDLKMINDTGYDLENIQVKYCLFYEQERMNHELEEKVNEIIVRPCLDEISILPNEFTERMSLKSIVLRDVNIIYVKTSGQWWVEVKEYLEGEGSTLRSEFIGAMLRIELVDPDGNIVRHEDRYPKYLDDGLGYDWDALEWVEPSEENTAWEDDFLDEISDAGTPPPTPFEEMGGVEEGEEE